MAIVHTADEMTALQAYINGFDGTYFTNGGGVSKYAWMDLQYSGSWAWSDATSASYTNWDAGKKHFVHLNKQAF